MRTQILGGAFLLITIAGCGGDSGPSLYSVTGTVTKGGAPLPGVSVTFSPESGPSSAGRTDDAGRFVLLSSTGKAGAVEGKHKVTLAAAAKQSTGELTGADFERMAADRDAAANSGSKGRPDEDEATGGVPADYANAATSPLEFTVTTGTNDFDIPLP